MNHKMHAPMGALLLLLSTACGLRRTDEASGLDTAGRDGTCMSDSWWDRGNTGSSRMKPGGDCIGCHVDMGEDPRYTVAGTVSRELDEPDDCDGAMDVTVEVVDANGTVFRDETNSAGNFYLRESSMRFPVRTRVIEGDAVRDMVAPIEHGNCADCHTAAGREGAPGRVLAP